MALVFRERPPSGTVGRVALLLHGFGADENDLFGLASLFSPAWRVLAVRAPLSYGPGFAWFGWDSGQQPAMADVASSVAQLSEFLDKEAQAQPTLLLGFSQGGLIAAATAAYRQSSGVCAVMSLSAPPLGTVPTNRPLAGLPVFWAHGRQDSVVSFVRGLQTRTQLIDSGADLSAFIYNMGHEICDQELNDMAAFITQKIR
jgi:phospholipase/carboxylesterase